VTDGIDSNKTRLARMLDYDEGALETFHGKN
jgi:hypothetical protein